jgi:hypothetical protein
MRSAFGLGEMRCRAKRREDLAGGGQGGFSLGAVAQPNQAAPLTQQREGTLRDRAEHEPSHGHLTVGIDGSGEITARLGHRGLRHGEHMAGVGGDRLEARRSQKPQ